MSKSLYAIQYVDAPHSIFIILLNRMLSVHFYCLTIENIVILARACPVKFYKNGKSS